MNKEKIAELKLQGFINQRDTRYFSLRIIAEAGNMSSGKMENVLKLANKYGKGYIGFTTRLGIEIPWIKEEDIESVKKDLETFGLRAGGTGKKIRPLVACKGTVCTHGLVDTQQLCSKLHEKYFAYNLPAKFKIGIVGCPNNCAKASLNDLGFMGQRLPRLEKDNCKACGLCASVCKAGAIEKIDKVVELHSEKCLGCGKCISACKFNAMVTDKEGVAIFIGGKFGRKYRLGDRLDIIFSLEQLDGLTQKILDYYSENAATGERFADMIDRIGLEKVKEALYINL